MFSVWSQQIGDLLSGLQRRPLISSFIFAASTNVQSVPFLLTCHVTMYILFGLHSREFKHRETRDASVCKMWETLKNATNVKKMHSLIKLYFFGKMSIFRNKSNWELNNHTFLQCKVQMYAYIFHLTDKSYGNTNFNINYSHAIYNVYLSMQKNMLHHTDSW